MKYKTQQSLYKWRIQDFTSGGGGGYAISKGGGVNLLFGKCFVENCIKTKEIGPPPLYRQWCILSLFFIIQQAFPVSNLDKVFNSNGKTTARVWVL